jgi:diguanylate cyclase (GGDEF)-like protein
MNPASAPAINRDLFLSRLATHLRQSRVAALGTGLFILDIKQFRRINLSLGFHCGDQVLLDIEGRLRKIVATADCVFRIGNNEFAIIVPTLQSPEFMQLIARQLQQMFDENFTWYDKEFRLDARIGATAIRDGDCTALHMLTAAESALAQAKAEGVAFLQRTITAESTPGHDWQFENDVLEALEENAFTLFWQPKIRLSDSRSLKAEGLLRWCSEKYGVVTPDRILPIIEYSGKMLDLTKFVISCALRQATKWPRQFGDMGVAVNIPANIIHHHMMRDIISDAISIWGVDPANLTLEITESAVIIDQESSFRNLQSLRDTGVCISIDDFGTGYSSLQYFKHIPADELKIDKSFVMPMARDTENHNIINLIIQLAHSFNIQVVAEGVEDEKSLQLLEKLGCDYAQGYHILRPVSNDDFVEWLTNSHNSWRPSS